MWPSEYIYTIYLYPLVFFVFYFFLIASDGFNHLPTQGYADYKHQVLYLTEVPDGTEGDDGGATLPMPVAT